MKSLIAQGAEAKIYTFSIDNKLYVSKERIPKRYRLKEIDEKLRRYRTRREISILQKASACIPVPYLHESSSEKDYTVIMEYKEGKKLADCLNDLPTGQRKKIAKEMGKHLALLHNKNIIHGDMTTSNMIWDGTTVYFIDFGLSFIDQKQEHKAVDLHLLRQALESRHHQHYKELYETILHSYKQYAEQADSVLQRLEIVEKRGRYKKRKKSKKEEWGG